MQTTTNLDFKLIDTTDKITDSLGYLNDNFNALDGLFGVIDLGKSLYLVDGVGISFDGLTLASLETGNYKINALYVNGTNETLWVNAIVRWNSTSNAITLIATPNSAINTSMVYLARIYSYVSNVWTLSKDIHIESSTTDLTEGTSPLASGSLYFVYE